MKKIIIPDNFMGAQVDGAMKRVLEKQNNKPIINSKPDVRLKNEEFIYVPDINLYVSKEKTLFNTNWNNAHTELLKNNQRMYTPYEAKAFLDYLLKNEKSGTLDASKDEIEKILDEILIKKDPWRAEWIDAYFEEKKGRLSKLYILTKNKTNSEELESCIMKDCYVELDSFNKQGFPTKKSNVQEYKKGENISFWYPRNGAVARFGVNSGRVYFDCIRYPSDSGASLGVRPCAEGTAPKK